MHTKSSKPIFRPDRIRGFGVRKSERSFYSGSKQARPGWQTSGAHQTSSGPSTVAVREHQYCAVGGGLAQVDVVAPK